MFYANTYFNMKKLHLILFIFLAHSVCTALLTFFSKRQTTFFISHTESCSIHSLESLLDSFFIVAAMHKLLHPPDSSVSMIVDNLLHSKFQKLIARLFYSSGGNCQPVS